MKLYKKILPLAIIFVSMVSCTDKHILDYSVDKPEELLAMEYVNKYDALKAYIDRTANPNFKLGSGVSVSDYISKNIVYRLTNANFDEMTAGNAMKYSSIVKDDGSMDFSQVSKFVDAAQLAGITIYGHTMCWHSQQNNKYLNSLLVDKPKPVDPNGGNRVLQVKSGDAKDNPWDWELYYDLDTPLEIGKSYIISFRIKGTNSGEIPFWPGIKDGSNTHYLPAFMAGEDWTNNSLTFTANAGIDRLRFCYGKLGGTLLIDDIELKEDGGSQNLIVNSNFDENDISHWTFPGWHETVLSIEQPAESSVTVWFENMVTNSNVEGTDMSSFFATEQKSGGPFAATIGETGTGADGIGHAIVVEGGDNPETNWSTQFFIRADRVLNAGDVCKLTLKYKADKAATSESQAHGEPGGYIYWDMGVNLNFTTEWQTFEKEFTISESQAGDSGMQTLAWNLSVLKEANKYYFDDVEFSIQKKHEGIGIPQTPQEKADTLTWALDKWISGMLKACDGYVTTWDVVNEPISGTDTNGDGIYELWSEKNVSVNDAQNNFYWQDYLGDDFVRTVVKLTRQYGPANMKLFVNDYNLESDWDDNKKLKSLIKWIERWEEDGTVIDGIGTQMHVSCYMNSAIQENKEKHVVQMLQLLAATGKLVKISELDMGLFDENGEKVLTENVTEKQHKAMSDYYTFIIEKYFEIIPAAQRYGITQWAVTDSPANSSWRGGEPIGIWNLNYDRKHTYAGFANGLAGKTVYVSEY